MTQIQVVIGPTGITQVKAVGQDQAEKLASLRLMEQVLPALERFDTILAEYLPDPETGEAE